ncbi:MAG: metallophosphoesterase [Bacteroidaceae bacterium]|nr:metallophosphoesterase [Bacteroidaceae bacterium]
MKRFTLLYLAAALWVLPMHAQQYFVSSLAVPGSATFQAGQNDNGVISVPFGAATRTIEVETNQATASVSCDASWCQASMDGKTLILKMEQNNGTEPRDAILTVRSKDFHPLLLTVRQEARLTFAVISDIHFGNREGEGPMVKVPQALTHLTARGPLDALAVVGDLTNGGLTEQYRQLVQVFGNDQVVKNPVGQFLFMMGNHDNYDSNGKSNYQKGLKAFNEGQDYPFHQYHIIKGYPFITISDFSGYNNDLTNSSWGEQAYPKESVEALENMLAQAAKDAPGKPIFVFTHVPPTYTCYSAWPQYENGEAWCMSVLNPVLNKYPQAVVFAGHSHYPLGDPRSIHQGANPNSTRLNYFTAINTASTTYSEIHPRAVDEGIHPKKYDYVTEGMILVEQPNGDIEIQRYDTYRDVEIDPENRWVLKAPFDGSQFQYADIRDIDDNPENRTLRDGLPAPVFPRETDIYVDLSSYDADITFPQATDNECVFRYSLQVFKGNAELKTYKMFSQFYLNNDMPETLTFHVDGLLPENEYVFSLTAYDSYDNASSPINFKITTPEDKNPANHVPDPKGCWTFDDANDLMAGTGPAILQAATHAKGNVTIKDPASAGITAVEGPVKGNGAIQVPVQSSLFMTTNLEAQQLSTYSFMMDIRLKELENYTALFQNDITNTRDGSFYVKNGQLGLNDAGLSYHGSLSSGEWHRVLFVVQDDYATVYLDGQKIGASNAASTLHWRMSTGAIFFGDEDYEEHVIETAELRFWDVALSAIHAAKLGAVDITGESEPLPQPVGCWTFDNPEALMVGTGVSNLQPSTHTQGTVTIVADPASVGITPVEGPTEGNGAINVPVNSSLFMTTRLGVESLDTYTLLWDIRSEDVSGYTPFLQNGLDNNKDGSLFIKNGQVGLGGERGLGYGGELRTGQWHRVVFVVKESYGIIYLDGQKVGQSTLPNPNHWKLGIAALFFADNDGEEKAIQTAEIRFWDRALSAAQVKEMGGTLNPRPTGAPLHRVRMNIKEPKP